VVGSLGGFDDEASIDEDDNSDGGEVSMAGSDPPDGRRGLNPWLVTGGGDKSLAGGRDAYGYGAQVRCADGTGTVLL
jgi:hypothetical protein